MSHILAKIIRYKKIKYNITLKYVYGEIKNNL